MRISDWSSDVCSSDLLAGAVAGAIIGSFLATLILRWPQGRSVVHGRSACDGCGLTLGGLELVPLFSALAQRGRCRACGAAIDPLHWRMEAGCALIGAVALGDRKSTRLNSSH